jgi:hypothetical protein
MSDAFFARVFHARGELVPIGTVSLTTYFHADTDDLASEDITRAESKRAARRVPFFIRRHSTSQWR